MKPYSPSTLEIWMREQGLSDIDLSSVLAKEYGIQVRSVQIGRWRRREQMPRPKVLAALRTLTGGRVTADSFLANEQ